MNCLDVWIETLRSFLGYFLQIGVVVILEPIERDTTSGIRGPTITHRSDERDIVTAALQRKDAEAHFEHEGTIGVADGDAERCETLPEIRFQ